MSCATALYAPRQDLVFNFNPWEVLSGEWAVTRHRNLIRAPKPIGPSPVLTAPQSLVGHPVIPQDKQMRHVAPSHSIGSFDWGGAAPSCHTLARISVPMG
ncbi:hypothetical protein XELAEV_18032550mg [Xenopus laevis]|uniref:Uncharacterized protein n=1 Tax=Xenopus laevis TaxID=8355 RepID=A0A974CPR8_XENLA|nr:hypothetical protein XELAEV_18032550mg [Xenopus laevis]